MVRSQASFALEVKEGGLSGFVRCTVTSKNRRIRFAIGCSRIPLSEWDAKREQRTGHSLESLTTNDRIKTVRGIVAQAMQEGRDIDVLPSLVNGTEMVKKERGVRLLYNRFLKARTDLAKATVKAFNVSLNAIEAYEKETSPITLASFYSDSPTATSHAKSLIKDLTTWLVDEYGYNDNTTTKALRHLQTVIKWHVSEGHAGAIPVNVPIGKRAPIEAQEKQALTRDEVSALWSLDIPEQTNLWHSRNGFVLACLTGQRYSDWHKIDPTKWREAYQIVSQQKTGDTAQILHTEEVRTILKLYAEKGWPPCIAKVKNSAIVNEHVKIACRMAGITRKVPDVVQRNGRKEVRAEREMCDVVSTHTARRTFVTIRQNEGDSRSDIMRRTGHRSEKSMIGYDKTTADQVAERFNVKSMVE